MNEKLRTAIRKEIERLTRFPEGYLPDWVVRHKESLINRAVEILEENNADKNNPQNIYRAAWLAIDENF
ncbi:hypothetical protein QNH23_06555 [Siminovitchia fortis]|uniref:Uncharacterized protein n=1 Tax=Siminovitchia fortis TaxID=254758 RepID=A0A443IMQ2_9BACI|nr:hypothetical protein [Siminovitchia fortis]RWR06762.1 hypothetical protein D4N35_013955 [Siminovitchia fortis]WHY83033.1 hypothetical protein QNH23_06555 [Siminovitchia fortis]